MAGVIAKNYAEALLNIALEENKVELYKRELTEISKVIDENNELYKLMNHPNVMKNDKKKVIRELFEVDQFVLNFLEIVIDKGRFGYFGDICREFNLQANKELNIEIAEITTASLLTEEELTKIRILLEKKFNKNIEIITKIDESCIAGVRIRIKDKLIDNTVEARLRAIKESIASSSLLAMGGDQSEFETGRNQ